MTNTTIYAFTTNGNTTKFEVAGTDQPGRDNALSHARALDRLAAHIAERAEATRRMVAERDAEAWA